MTNRNIVLRESGHDTGMDFDEVCEGLEGEGFWSPRELGHNADSTIFFGAEYAKSELLDPGETWNTDLPYWYAK